jgi:site-specific recombinase XerD
VSAPLALATWDEIESPAPVLAATMRRYLQQIACSLRPGSVMGVEFGLRSFAGFLLEAHPDVITVAAVTRAHIEAYKPWLAARPGQRVPQLTVNTRAHRLGTLRMFFLRLEEWGWDDRPEHVPILFGDLPRQDKPLPKALDDPATAKFLRAAQNQPRLLVRVVCEVLIRTGLRVSELIALQHDAVVQIGAGAWASLDGHDPALRQDRQPDRRG